MIKTTMLYLVASEPLTASRDFAALKKLAAAHGGAYMPAVRGNKATLAEASFAFATEERRQMFISSLAEDAVND